MSPIRSVVLYAPAGRRRRSAERIRLQPAGFSLTELLLVVAIIGMVNGLAVAFSGSEWQRERVNSVAVGLAGWLEEVRGNALREINAVSSAGGCVVTISSLTNVAAGTSLASVSPSSCASTASFDIPGLSTGSDRYDIASSSPATITFTPRGSVTSTSDALVKVFLRDSRQLRCVRVSAILGLVRVGSNAAAGSIADSCTDFSRF